MKRKLLIVLLLAMVVFLACGCGTGKSPSKDKAIIGEWEYDAAKNGTTETVSNFKFDENNDFKWLVVNGSTGGTILYDGSYIAADTLSLIVGADKPAEFEYSFDGEYLEFDGLYYKRAESLNFTPSAQKPVASVEATTATAPTPVSIDLSTGKYIVGTDIPAGKYDITATSGHGNFFGRPGIVNEIMGADSGSYTGSYSNAVFNTGNEIEISGTLTVNLTSK